MLGLIPLIFCKGSRSFQHSSAGKLHTDLHWHMLHSVPCALHKRSSPLGSSQYNCHTWYFNVLGQWNMLCTHRVWAWVPRAWAWDALIYALAHMNDIFLAACRPNNAWWMVLYSLNLLIIENTHPGLRSVLAVGLFSIWQTFEMRKIFPYPLKPLPLSLAHVNCSINKINKAKLMRDLEAKTVHTLPVAVSATVVDVMIPDANPGWYSTHLQWHYWANATSLEYNVQTSWFRHWYLSVSIDKGHRALQVWGLWGRI